MADRSDLTVLPKDLLETETSEEDKEDSVEEELLVTPETQELT